jgi:hypothetical protein
MKYKLVAAYIRHVIEANCIPGGTLAQAVSSHPGNKYVEIRSFHVEQRLELSPDYLLQPFEFGS